MKVEDMILSGIADFFKRSREIIFYVAVGFIAIQFYEKFFPDDCLHIDNPAYQYDFRKTKWGMTPEAVKAVESGNDDSRFIKEEKDKYFEKLYYEDFSHRFVTDVVYTFTDHGLGWGDYSFRIKNNGKETMVKEYDYIRQEITAKYGKPKKVVDNLDGKKDKAWMLQLRTVWETPSTEISLDLSGFPEDDQYHIEMYYKGIFKYTYNAEKAGYYY